MIAFISPAEILIIGLLIMLLIAGKYFYNKLREGRHIYQKSLRNKDD